MSQDIVIKLKTDDKDIESTIKQMQKMGLIDEKNAKEFTKNQKKYSDGYKKQGREISKLDKMVKNVGTTLAGAFAVQQLVGFGKEIISTTAEFEKLEAVLTNTLGSQSEAQKSLDMIQLFASETPFSVLELTDSFVKLTNQGFKPTQSEMKKLGDLASSTGKTFDQLAEGIIDAQVGEFERMKEFGIRAQKEGDKVKFTFKGVETQVDNTAESIQGYILSLGDMGGVSGSMDAISKTMGGQISNLGDTYDAFLLSLGSTDTIFGQAVSGGISVLSELLKTLTVTGTESENLTKEWRSMKEETEELERSMNPLLDRHDELASKSELTTDEQKELDSIIQQVAKNIPTAIRGFDKYGKAMGISTDAARGFVSAQRELLALKNKEALDANTEAFTEQANIIAGLSRRYREASDGQLLYLKQLGHGKHATYEWTEATAEQNIAYAKTLALVHSTKRALTLQRDELLGGTLAKRLDAKATEELGDVVEDVDAAKDKAAEKERQRLAKAEREFQKYMERAQQMAIKGAEDDAKLTAEFWAKEDEAERMVRDARIETNLEGDAQEIARLKAKHEDRLLTFDEEAIEYNELVMLSEKKLQDDIDAVNERRVKKNKASNDAQQRDDDALRKARIEGAATELAALGGFFNAVGNLYSKQSQANKFFTLFGIGLDMASAIASLTAASEANPSNSVTYGGAGAAQFIAGMTRIVSNIGAAKQAMSSPSKNEFKDGVILLDGEGTETSDSIPAMLSKNESVIKAKQSRKYSELLRAINDDTLDNYIMKNWNFAPNLPNVKTGGDEAWIDNLTQTLGMNGFSGDEIVGALRNNDRNENKRLNLLIDAISKNNHYKSHRK